MFSRFKGAYLKGPFNKIQVNKQTKNTYHSLSHPEAINTGNLLVEVVLGFYRLLLEFGHASGLYWDVCSGWDRAGTQLFLPGGGPGDSLAPPPLPAPWLSCRRGFFCGRDWGVGWRRFGKFFLLRLRSGTKEETPDWPKSILGADGRGDGQSKLSGVMRPEAQGDQLWGQVHVSSVLKLNGSVGCGQGAVLERDSPTKPSRGSCLSGTSSVGPQSP